MEILTPTRPDSLEQAVNWMMQYMRKHFGLPHHWLIQGATLKALSEAMKERTIYQTEAMLTHLYSLPIILTPANESDFIIGIVTAEGAGIGLTPERSSFLVHEINGFLYYDEGTE